MSGDLPPRRRPSPPRADARPSDNSGASTPNNRQAKPGAGTPGNRHARPGASTPNNRQARPGGSSSPSGAASSQSRAPFTGRVKLPPHPEASASPSAARPALGFADDLRASTGTATDARAIAARVVERVIEDAAWAAASLDSELERSIGLLPRERALATELVYTTLRSRPALEAALSKWAPRGLPEDPRLRSHLLIAAAQLLLLDRVPAGVAVSHAVDRIRQQRGAKMAGFANALLRKISSSGQRLDRAAALRESCPSWLYQRIVAAVGVEETDALLGIVAKPEVEAVAQSRSVGLRVVGDAALPEWLEALPRGPLAPQSRRANGLGDPRRLPGYAEGRFVVQEEGAQVIGALVAAQPGERILDVCAGRGQKTLQLAEAVGPSGHVVATDLYPRKLEALDFDQRRLRLAPVETRLCDWSVGGGDLRKDFDAILVDAPCTGTGTVLRRPEIAGRLMPSDPLRIGQLAALILHHAAGHLRRGGRIIFAVCSVLPEEAEGVLASVADLLEPEEFGTPLAELAFGPGATQGRLLPLRHGTDGYFVARLRLR